MAEESKEKRSEDYQFINEEIVPKKKNKWLKRLETLLFVLFLAVVFGVVSGVVFLWSGNRLEDWMETEDKRQQVELPRPTAKPKNTVSPTPTPVVKDPVVIPPQLIENEIENKEEKKASDEEQLVVTSVPENENEPIQTEKPVENEAMNSYLQIYEVLRDVATKVSESFVTVEIIEQEVDWFKEVYEKRTRTNGIVLGNDGVDLLVLIGTEQFTSATSIELLLEEYVVKGRMYSVDKDYGLAVVAVPLKEIPGEILNNIQLGFLAEKDEITVGTPVIALGAPNGYENSMEFGMITSTGSTIPVTDGEVAYFTTNITEYPDSYGYVVNLDGKVLGMITHKYKENSEDGIFSAVSLDSVQGIIVKLLNNAKRTWFGIKGQDIPKRLAREYGLESGIYVIEVENASPALNAGIKAGDIILSVEEEAVQGIREFSDKIMRFDSRTTLRVKILRKSAEGLRELSLDVLLADKK